MLFAIGAVYGLSHYNVMAGRKSQIRVTVEKIVIDEDERGEEITRPIFLQLIDEDKFNVDRLFKALNPDD